MKPIAAFPSLMVCLAFSVFLLSCVEREDVTGPESGYTIQGTVQYWRDQSAAAGMTIELRSAYAETTCITDSTGSFCFTDLENHVYHIVPIGTEEVDCYFSPESTEVVVSGEDITVSRFLAFRYSKVILNNNGLWKVVGVKAARSDNPDDWTDNLLSNDLAPFTGSEEIHLIPNTWFMEITWIEDTKQFRDLIEIGYILPEDSLVFPLNSIIKIQNNSSKIIEKVEIFRPIKFPGETVTYTNGRNFLNDKLLPGFVSEDIYVWRGFNYIKLTYLEDSVSDFFTTGAIDIPPGDTVYIPFPFEV
jgi:hypothetical protein